MTINYHICMFEFERYVMVLLHYENSSYLLIHAADPFVTMCIKEEGHEELVVRVR